VVFDKKVLFSLAFLKEINYLSNFVLETLHTVFSNFLNDLKSNSSLCEESQRGRIIFSLQ